MASELVPNQMLRGSQIREEKADFDNVIARYLKMTNDCQTNPANTTNTNSTTGN